MLMTTTKAISKNSIFKATIIIILMLIIIINPFQNIRRGFYSDDITFYAPEKSNILKSEEIYDGMTIDFIPKEKYFSGLGIYITRAEKWDNGQIVFSILDMDGKEITSNILDSSQIKNNYWNKIDLESELNVGKKYTISLNLKGVNNAPYLLHVAKSILPIESADNNLLVAYGYQKDTFDFPTIVILYLIILGIIFWILSTFFNDKGRKKLKTISAILLLTAIISSNFYYYFLSQDEDDLKMFNGYQKDSESLVTNYPKYFYDSQMEPNDYNFYLHSMTTMSSSIDHKEFKNSYSSKGNELIFPESPYTSYAIQPGNIIKFSNEYSCSIKETYEKDGYIVAKIDTKKPLSYKTNGDLEQAEVYNNGTKLQKYYISGYYSQYGLQGRLFRYLFLKEDYGPAYLHLQLFYCVSLALVFVLISYLVYKKYNFTIAVISLLCFSLSPLVTYFARNLYWVEVLWFIPALIGLFCSLKIESRAIRILSYILAFGSIAIKCLCGYEYISTIMLASVSILLIDFVHYLVQKDRTKAKLTGKAIILLGIFEVLGFFVAMYFHARKLEIPSFIEGIKYIFNEVGQKRISGIAFNSGYAIWDSYNASLWKVILMYFKFPYYFSLFVGVGSNIFTVLVIASLFIHLYDIYKNNVNHRLLSAYVFFFLTTLSWILLAKGHSYVHTHMNYVLWYFGFIQVCVYTIVNKIISCIKSISTRNK